MAGILKSVAGKAKLNISNIKFGLVVAEWNEDITAALAEGAVQGLLQLGAKKTNIIQKQVPGSFELPLAAQRLAEKKEISAVICIGCVIRGDTPHFDYICQAVAQGIMDVNLKTKKPIAFGVLTTLNRQQALERAGGKLGNKGEEAAVTVVKMLE